VKRTIAVAMSGGVDSSTTAALLAERGEEIFGLMLRLWSPSGERNRCCSPDAMASARRVAGLLGAPFYVIDARQQFKRRVVDRFVEGYRRGVTPNPCITCNQEIRWTLMLEHAISLGATHMATGHYARLSKCDDRIALERAVDRDKDQSYVLSFLRQDQLAKTVLPLGSLKKAQVRAHARRLGLPVADRPDSQDLCFLGDADYRHFLQNSTPSLPPAGPIVDQGGTILGQHQGLHNYTIGQRRGIGISAHEALYVLEKDLEGNRLIVGPRASLGRRSFSAEQVNWIAPAPPSSPLKASVQVRYNGQEAEATLFPQSNGQVCIELESPLLNITPGQGSVFYQGERCLGGGIIAT
jgi:tRNA-specific 2-thiouridylase